MDFQVSLSSRVCTHVACDVFSRCGSIILTILECLPAADTPIVLEHAALAENLFMFRVSNAFIQVRYIFFTESRTCA